MYYANTKDMSQIPLITDTTTESNKTRNANLWKVHWLRFVLKINSEQPTPSAGHPGCLKYIDQTQFILDLPRQSGKFMVICADCLMYSFFPFLYRMSLVFTFSITVVGILSWSPVTSYIFLY